MKKDLSEQSLRELLLTFETITELLYDLEANDAGHETAKLYHETKERLKNLESNQFEQIIKGF